MAVLRFANVLGPDIVTPIIQGARACPWCRRSSASTRSLQFVEEDDVVRAIEFAMRSRAARRLQRGR